MTAKQNALMEQFLERVDPAWHGLFRAVAEHAAALGYPPARTRTSDVCIDFRSSRLGRTLMKLEEHEQKHDGFRYKERAMPGLRLRFHATPAYSHIFQEGIRRVIEEFDGRYTGCYGCGACKGELLGYTYAYPDGRRVFRCGRELISVFDFTPGHAGEICALMDAQHAQDEAVAAEKA